MHQAGVKIPRDEEIYQRVRKTVAEVLRQSADGIEPDSQLGEELGMTSLDFVDFEFRLEREFGIEFYHGSAVAKLADLLAPRELEQHGLLTPFGAVVLRLRLPEMDPHRLQEGKSTAGIEAMFSPRTWIRVIKEVLNARPQTCPQCKSDRLEVQKPSVLLCKSCRQEVRCPDGEECLTTWAKSLPDLLGESQGWSVNEVGR